MIKPLLIEIGVEELPAIPFLKELDNIEKKWVKILEEKNLLCEFEFYFTPRRLVLWHREFPTKQEDSLQEFYGAPVKIAFKDGEPTGAALGFAKKCGVDVSELGRKDQGRGEVLYYKKNIEGEYSKNLLNDMINQFISSLSFGKTMRWGSRTDSFIRPIRSLCVLMEKEIIPCELFGVKSNNLAFAHRMVSYEPFSFKDAKEYFDKIKQNGIVLYPEERRKIILSQMEEIEKVNNIKIEIDKELLEEVVAITEYPTALIGSFEKEYLQLPEEVIITSMKENQRYFAVYSNDKLTNKFIVVSNSYTENFDYIVKGNEKVLKPRLEDAMFFYRNDIKNGLNNEGLKKVIFVEGLGSMYDKTLREVEIASYLANVVGIKEKDLLKRAVMLTKADLLSEMVYEFTELEGLMGYYYAKNSNEDPLVYTAIKEQYLPDGENSELPSNKLSAIVALAYKIDNLMGLFSVNKIPTGSKDPFGLRRAAAGIVRIVIEHKMSIDLSLVVDNLKENYQGLNKDKLMEFIAERLFKFFDVNPSVLKAVLESGETDIYKIFLKVNALNPIVLSENFKEYSTTFKRVANIIKDVNVDKKIEINEELFECNEERDLCKRYQDVDNKKYNSYEEQLDSLFSLKPQLDNFFDNVFVNHENIEIKNNRKNLIALVYQSFKQIADIKEISI